MIWRLNARKRHAFTKKGGFRNESRPCFSVRPIAIS